jgi:hypothetical protein
MEGIWSAVLFRENAKKRKGKDMQKKSAGG